MPFRVSYFFGCSPTPGAGWSENYWNLLNERSQVETAGRALKAYLDGCHAKEVVCQYMRISEVGAFRRVKPVEFGGENTVAVAADSADYPTNALLLELGTTAGSPAREFATRQWFRGVPDRQIEVAKFAPKGVFVNNLQALRGQLTNSANGWCLRLTDRSPPYKAVSSISVTGEVRVPNHGFNTGDQVRMHKVSPRVGINKVWKITVLTTDTFQLDRFRLQPATWVYDGTGLCRKISYIYSQIQSFDVLRASKRNVGRPTRLFIGRQRKVLR